MRIVLDTNVLVSSILSPSGVPSQIRDLWNAKEFELITSDPQIERMRGVLSRAKFADRIPEGDKEKLFSEIRDAATFVEPAEGITDSPDPEDNVILATAVAGQADMVVTGDKKHLLPLGSVQGISIVEPTEAIERIRQSKE